MSGLLPLVGHLGLQGSCSLSRSCGSVGKDLLYDKNIVEFKLICKHEYLRLEVTKEEVFGLVELVATM